MNPAWPAYARSIIQGLNATTNPGEEAADRVEAESIQKYVHREAGEHESDEEVEVGGRPEPDGVVEQPDRAGDERIRELDGA